MGLLEFLIIILVRAGSVINRSVASRPATPPANRLSPGY
jgi:hypothetical protein